VPETANKLGTQHKGISSSMDEQNVTGFPSICDWINANGSLDKVLDKDSKLKGKGKKGNSRQISKLTKKSKLTGKTIQA
jgi:hypothetical protein